METRSRTKVRLANAKSDPILARTRAYNSTTLIARLSNEVLSRIFLLHKVAVIKAYRARQQYEDCHTFTAVPWISPTHVCTLWRSIALECTAFWNTLLLGNPVPIPERIRRSKQGLLDISGYHTDVAPGIVVKSLALVISESRRIEALDLSFIEYILRSWGWEMVVPSILAALEGAMFPAIRQVTIHGVEKTKFSDGIHDSCQDVLLRLIRQPMIGLTDLRMENCPVVFWQPFPQETLRKLTSLSVVLKTPILSHFRSFLTTVPNLRLLVLKNLSLGVNSKIPENNETTH